LSFLSSKVYVTADAFIEGKNRQSSSQIFFSLEVKNNNRNNLEMGLLSMSNLAICIKKSGFKA